MDSSAPALLAASVWFVVYLGYVLIAGTGIFWVAVWPEGHALRRLRVVAAVGLGLTTLGTLAEGLVERVVAPSADEAAVADASVAWLLVRLAALAAAGFFGAELLRRPVLGGRRITVLALVLVLTITLVIESAAIESPQLVVIMATTGIYLLSLAAWLGGLVALAALLVPRQRPSGLEQIWSRLSWFAGLSVLTLAVSGASLHVLSGGTATSRSGVLLLVEVLALAATLVLSRYAVAYGRRLAFRERYLRGFAIQPGGRRPMLGHTIGIQMVLSLALVGVAVAQLAVLPVPGRPGTPPLGDPIPTAPVPTAREGRPVSKDPTGFIPQRIELPGGEHATVVPVATVGRELVVPEHSGRVGWWDGSSYVGDEYGSTVIAGHVDTVHGGLGFFFQLWNVDVGDRVVLTAGNARQAYRITKVHEVPRTDLVDDDEVFAVDAPHRLVLITCAGEFRRERGGYNRNLVVVARPVS